MSAILAVEGLSKAFGGLMALSDLSFSVREGEIFGLIGPNGAGKTTLFNILSGLTRPTTGTVHLLGRDITGQAPAAVARLGLARTFQNIRLFGGMSVLDNVRVPRHALDDTSLWGGVFGTPRARAQERAALALARELVELVGLGAQMDATAASLPYGARRRLEIARALALAPKILLLDEPAAGLNQAEKQELSRFIRDIRDRFCLTVLLIEHNVPLVMGLCRSVAVLNFGQLIAQGAPEAIQADPAVIEAYLGRDGQNQKEAETAHA